MMKEGFTPEERDEVTNYIRDASVFHNEDIMYGEAVELSQEFDCNPIADMERILREIGSDIYLLAVPINEEDIRDDQEIVMPHSGDQKYPFFLFIIVGLENAQQWMSDLRINPEENSANLENTGLMQSKKGTEGAREDNARYN